MRLGGTGTLNGTRNGTLNGAPNGTLNGMGGLSLLGGRGTSVRGSKGGGERNTGMLFTLGSTVRLAKLKQFHSFTENHECV